MNKLYILFLVFLAVFCSSCHSYKIYPKEYRKLENTEQQRKAYVSNDSLEQELKILMSSGLFKIVADSTIADIKLKLYPVEQMPTCGQPIMVSIITLGLVPVSLPNRYVYKFDEIENDIITQRTFDLELTQSVSLWNVFAFNKRFEEKMGKVLFGTYVQKEQ